MGNADAENKFYEVLMAIKKLYTENDKVPIISTDEKVFQMILVDIEAALPGLTDVKLGRALLIKADCLYWLLLKKWYNNSPRLVAVDSDPDPLIKGALTCALKGRKILKESGSTEDLPRADDFIKKLKDSR